MEGDDVTQCFLDDLSFTFLWQVRWSISYFDIIAWGSSNVSFKLVLKLSKKDPKSPRTSQTPKGQKEPTFDVKFRTYSVFPFPIYIVPEGVPLQGKRMAICIRCGAVLVLD